MSRSSFTIGLAVSLLVHGMFLLTGHRKEVTYQQVRPEPKNVAKLILPPAPSAEAAPKEQPKEEPKEQPKEEPKEQPKEEPKEQPKAEPKEQPKAEPKEQPKAEPKEQPKEEPVKQSDTPQIENLEEIVKRPETEFAKGIGDFSDNPSSDLVPELRLIWDSPEQLIRVAKSLGMRILIVNGRNEPVGELIFDQGLSVKEFKGNLTNFSNRVRTISAHFFGPEVLRQSNKSVQCFWVVVPASVDRTWVSVQKQAIRSKGLNGSQVSYMEARVIPNGSGYELVVNRIATL